VKPATSFVLALVAIFVAGAALVVALSSRADRGGKTGPETYELAPAMGHMQRFAEKLYFAGQANNWPLADFYLHEIEESAEEIIQAGVVDEGVAVSSFLKAMLPPALAGVKEAVQKKDRQQFLSRYEGLVASCNACHQSTKHGFVRITVPRQPTYQNQDFAPQ
jgi:cytochrome c553